MSATEKEAGGEEKRFSPNYDDNKKAPITTDWLTAKCEGNILTVTIQPTTQDANRFIKVEVETYDAPVISGHGHFRSFSFFNPSIL